MTIIPTGCDWPKESFIDEAGLSKERHVAFSKLFYEAHVEWLRKAALKPTHIAIPIEFKRIIIGQFHTVKCFNAIEGDTVYGLKIIWALNGRMELLSNVPL